jgi:gluconate 2-dehydrogenase
MIEGLFAAEAGRILSTAAAAPRCRKTRAAALDQGTLRCWPDVFATSRCRRWRRRARHPRVTPLPHIGSATHETRHAMAALAPPACCALAGKAPSGLRHASA